METEAVDIGIVVKRFPKLSETFIAGEISELKRQGIGLRLLSIWRPNEALVHEASRKLSELVTYFDEAQVSGADQIEAAKIYKSRSSWIGSARQESESTLITTENIGRLTALIRQFRLKHLHVHYLGQPADLASCACRMTGITYSVSAHAKDVYTTEATRIRASLADSAFVATCTQHNVDFLKEIAPEHQHKLTLIKHGIDTDYFRPPESVNSRQANDPVPLILGVGRYKHKKGFDLLVHACKLLAQRGVSFECEIVGYGDQKDALLALIAEQGLTGKIQLRAPETQDRIRDLMQRSTIFVLPCRVSSNGDRDGIPNSVLEAMACGLPVISTTVSGVPEVIKSAENGLLVEPENPHMLAEALEQVLRNRALATRLGATARSSICEGFSWQANVMPLADELRKLTGVAQHQDQTA